MKHHDGSNAWMRAARAGIALLLAASSTSSAQQSDLIEWQSLDEGTVPAAVSWGRVVFDGIEMPFELEAASQVATAAVAAIWPTVRSTDWGKGSLDASRSVTEGWVPAAQPAAARLIASGRDIQGRQVLALVVDRLPSPSPIVLRWLTAFVTIDEEGRAARIAVGVQVEVRE